MRTTRAGVTVALLAGALAPTSWAQGADAANPVTSTVVITGNPLGSERTLLPAAVLSGNGLALRRAATLGETLDGLPGVAASGFGPNASRPVIRGLDGDRVRLLDNGGAVVDASSLSFDHAVALEPLLVERLEVLRGPAVLLYGGSATGGVVNAIHNRIPRALPEAVDARVELRAGGAADERAAVALLEGGAGTASAGLAWHVDAFGRRAEDPRVPRFTPVEHGTPLAPAERVRNAAARSEGGAVGASFIGAAGHAGLSVETLRNRYGVTVEPDVTIRLQRERQAFAGQWALRTAGIERIAVDAAHTDYRHEEVEGSGEVGTVFESRSDDARLELRHAPLGGAGGPRGVLGAQWERMHFSALGEEAFVPGTRTQQHALFVYEEWRAGAAPNARDALVLNAGARVERVRVASQGDAPDAAQVRFGPAASRRFAPQSASLGARLPLPRGMALSASLSHSERAPTYYELYANGVHVATGAFERGDTALATERSRHAELGLAWAAGPHKVELHWFTTRFANYIALEATGNGVTLPPEDPADPPQGVPEYAFRAVRARLRGFELEARTQLAAAAASRVELTLTLDQVRGDNVDRGEPLPRLAPRRARLGFDVVAEAWRAGLVVRHAARQDRVPATDTPTPGYTLFDLWGAVPLPLPGEASAFARLGNVTDRLGYNAAAVATVRALAPLPGRALALGVRWRW